MAPTEEMGVCTAYTWEMLRVRNGHVDLRKVRAKEKASQIHQFSIFIEVLSESGLYDDVHNMQQRLRLIVSRSFFAS